VVPAAPAAPVAR